MSNASLPSRCDVLVVGAGPAGSACALWLARAGIDVVLIDQHDFPRDKICGDALIPDAHHALKRMGLYDEVMTAAQPAQHLACIGPRGGRVDVPGSLAVLPRLVLDDIVCRGAQRAGAKLFTPWRFEGTLMDGDVVVGARLKQGGNVSEIQARWVVLATGATPQALIAADMCDRRTPSGIALRGYVKSDAMVGKIQALEVVWDKNLAPGYGWIFPAPDGRFNIGVGVANSHPAANDSSGKMKDVNLRQLFDAFCQFYPPARELMRHGKLEGDLKGAPLRCSLAGARHARAGLLVAGEAAGSTYAFTGEGIGKAFETGLLAAETLVNATGGVPAGTQADVCTRYEAGIAGLKPRFDLYERANQINAHPWLADLLIWRANKSARLLKRMAGVLEETSNPGNLVSIGGFFKVFFPGLSSRK
ncbi:MAG: geranylgeranyl reductase family protein [Burkholderiaceae bacterium]